jgi:hypothetical protein
MASAGSNALAQTDLHPQALFWWKVSKLNGFSCMYENLTHLAYFNSTLFVFAHWYCVFLKTLNLRHLSGNTNVQNRLIQLPHRRSDRLTSDLYLGLQMFLKTTFLPNLASLVMTFMQTEPAKLSYD